MDVPGDPALSGRRSPTVFSRATTNEEGQAEQMLPTSTTIPEPRVLSDYCASYKLGYSWTVTTLSPAREQRRSNKTTIRPRIKIHNTAVCSTSVLFLLSFLNKTILIQALCEIRQHQCVFSVWPNKDEAPLSLSDPGLENPVKRPHFPF